MRPAKRVSYRGKYAGAKIVGTKKVEAPTAYRYLHMERAFYLTAQMEAPIWGAVQSYDGAAMSGGPMHWIAVFPKTMKQGPLFGLLRRIEVSAHCQAYTSLHGALLSHGWFVSRDGRLRARRTGKLVSGHAIRDVFTPTGGKVGPKGSKSWKSCEAWTRSFYDLLSDPSTFEAQKDHSIEYLIRGAKRSEMAVYRQWIPGIATPEDLESEICFHLPARDGTLPMAVDFAMCVYHSFSPNAPGMARVVLDRVMKRYRVNYPKPRESDPQGTRFAKRLIRALGKTKYGRWHDKPGERGSRYDRTRVKAKQSKLWPEEFTTELMPKDL